MSALGDEFEDECVSSGLLEEADVFAANDEDEGTVTRLRLLDDGGAEDEGACAAEARSDADGDLVLPRRRAPREDAVVLRSARRTPLHAVGLQLWRGALLLADLVLSEGPCWDGATALELGAGTGLVSLLLARRAARVFLTDCDAAVLRNAARNAAAAAHRFAAGPSAVRVRALDWTAPPPWAQAHASTGGVGGPAAAAPLEPQPFAWSAADLTELRDVSVVVAADCIFDDALTDAFWTHLRALFAHCAPLRCAYVAAERRVNFATSDMTARAHAFDHFRSKFRVIAAGEGGADAAAAEGSCAAGAAEDTAACELVGVRLDVASVPQRVAYTRTPELELWRIIRAPPR